MSTRTDISRTFNIGILTMIALLLLGTGSFEVSAKGLVRDTVKETVKVHYRVGKYNLDPAFKNNKARLDSLVEAMGDSLHLRKLTKIEVIGGASPEGSVKLNNRAFWACISKDKRLYIFLQPI